MNDLNLSRKRTSEVVVKARNGKAEWHYFADPEAEPCPKGELVYFLVKGGGSVKGVMREGMGYVAWAPLIKRDKEKETRLGIVV